MFISIPVVYKSIIYNNKKYNFWFASDEKINKKHKYL